VCHLRKMINHKKNYASCCAVDAATSIVVHRVSLNVGL
jgi:hypothetical protein